MSNIDLWPNCKERRMKLCVQILNTFLIGIQKYLAWQIGYMIYPMMTSSNRNIFRVTGHLCGEFTGQRWIPRTKASDVSFLDPRLNKRLSKQWRGWWFETPSRPLWRQSNAQATGQYNNVFCWGPSLFFLDKSLLAVIVAGFFVTTQRLTLAHRTNSLQLQI